jgi:hypothetical protein
MPTCEHRACQSIDLAAADIVLTERPSLIIERHPERQTWWEVTGPDGRFLGTISDQGYRAHPTRGGDWRHEWLVVAGGQGVPLAGNAWLNGEWVKTSESLAATVQEFARWCQRTAFGWRMALHG